MRHGTGGLLRYGGLRMTGRRRAARKDQLITCHDLVGRRRSIVVFADAGRVVLIAPAGETAVLTPLEVGRLRAALRDVVMEAAEQVAG
jgi:hypothetical protein